MSNAVTLLAPNVAMLVRTLLRCEYSVSTQCATSENNTEKSASEISERERERAFGVITWVLDNE